eukprot:11217311-Lingulodinium_polyedra.AAC.1
MPSSVSGSIGSERAAALHTSPAADDVWDILRKGAAPLRRVLQSVPPRGLLLIVGGSPCQELT